MKRSQLALLLMFGAGMTSVLISACSSDDSSGGGAGSGGQSGGSGGKGGSSSGGGGTGATAGHGGTSAGGSSGHGGSSAGGAGGTQTSGGQGGSAAGAGPASGGEGGAPAGEGGSGGEAGAAHPCAPALTKPTVASDIAVAAAAVLVAAYAAEGTQTYTCTQTGPDETATYAWSTTSVPSANLYGADCTLAATHYAGPHWKAKDGSIILGTKVRGVASANAASIQQLLLSTVVDGGDTGIFSPVTAVQRLNTVGGVAPTTGCDHDHVDGTVAVPYTATYYFYSGSNIIPPA